MRFKVLHTYKMNKNTTFFKFTDWVKTLAKRDISFWAVWQKGWRAVRMRVNPAWMMSEKRRWHREWRWLCKHFPIASSLTHTRTHQPNKKRKSIVPRWKKFKRMAVKCTVSQSNRRANTTINLYINTMITLFLGMPFHSNPLEGIHFFMKPVRNQVSYPNLDRTLFQSGIKR